MNNCLPFTKYEFLNKKYETEQSVQRMLFTDMEIELPHTYLEKVDKSTMLNSIEARVPFLDNELVSYVRGLPATFKVNKNEKV